MAILWRILISIVAGCVFYAGLLFIIFRLIIASAMSPIVFRILLWNVILFGFWGRGAPVGSGPDGSPIYDASAGLLGFSWESILTGFVIYPMVIFCGLLIARRRQAGRVIVGRV